MFVLAGMMIGPLLFNWRFVAQSLRQLTISRRLPEQIFAGRPFRVEICGQNHRRRLGSWMIVVDDCVHADVSDRESRKREPKPNASVVLPHVAAGGSGAAAYQVTLPQRGRYLFGPLRVSTRFPMGLVRATTKLKQFDRVVVWPRLGRLTPYWLGLLDSRRLGRQTTHCKQGPIDGDYYGLREWRSGDSKRWIHWRTTAKLGKLAVRQFEQQQNQDLALVLDLWQPDLPRDEDRGRVEVAVSFAATLVDELARRGGSRVTIALAVRAAWHLVSDGLPAVCATDTGPAGSGGRYSREPPGGDAERDGGREPLGHASVGHQHAEQPVRPHRPERDVRRRSSAPKGVGNGHLAGCGEGRSEPRVPVGLAGTRSPRSPALWKKPGF